LLSKKRIQTQKQNKFTKKIIQRHKMKINAVVVVVVIVVEK